MLISQILDDFYQKKPIFKEIYFSRSCFKSENEILPSLFVITQYIIDKLIELGKKRIAIVMPSDDCDVFPLVVANYTASILSDTSATESLFERIKPGQHLKLGKAVVEFLGLKTNEQKQKRIVFRVDKKDPTIIQYSLGDIKYQFEKTNGVVTSNKTWVKESQLAREKVLYHTELVQQIKEKKTSIRKTIIMLTHKNEFIDQCENWFINNSTINDLISYGECNNSCFHTLNKGNLDCLPGITVSTRIEELYYLLRESGNQEKVSALYSSLAKFDELISSADTLRKVLKSGIPFIAFIPESGFESFPVLRGLGFEFWHWKPSTMKSEALLNSSSDQDKIFGLLNHKIRYATLAEYDLICIKNSSLKDAFKFLFELSKQVQYGEASIRTLERGIFYYQIFLSRQISFSEFEKESMFQRMGELKSEWRELRSFYVGQNTEILIEHIFELQYQFIASSQDNTKQEKLIVLVNETNEKGKRIVILVQDNYSFFENTKSMIESLHCDSDVLLMKLTDFLTSESNSFLRVDLLIVTWFEKDAYLKIKQTYCYSRLVFVLYNFENAWRNNFLERIDQCVPHETLKAIAQEINISSSEIYAKPIDEFEDDVEKQISHYDISNWILTSTIRGVSNDYIADSTASVECIPVLLSGDKIGYFYFSRDLITLSVGHDLPRKKEAGQLKKNDRILIRQSGKDIVREKADSLMNQKSSQDYRCIAGEWFTLLEAYGKGKTLSAVQDDLNKAGCECSTQQLRFWLSGEVIMPRDKEVLVAIGKLPMNSDLKEQQLEFNQHIDKVFETGKLVQRFHQQAGRILTQELSNRAKEIKDLANSNNQVGDIPGIGEVAIYTVCDVLEKQIIDKSHLNRIEDL